MDDKQKEIKIKEHLKKLNYLLGKERYDEVNIMCDELIPYWNRYNYKLMVDFFEKQLKTINKILS